MWKLRHKHANMQNAHTHIHACIHDLVVLMYSMVWMDSTQGFSIFLSTGDDNKLILIFIFSTTTHECLLSSCIVEIVFKQPQAFLLVTRVNNALLYPFKGLLLEFKHIRYRANLIFCLQTPCIPWHSSSSNCLLHPIIYETTRIY